MYGTELVLDFHDCDPTHFNADDLERYCKELCELIDMQKEDFHVWASDPKDYGKEPPHLYGTSVVQFIQTSSLVIHTLPKLRAIYLNIFSCKSFDPITVLLFTQEFFAGTLAKHTLIGRM